MQQHINLLEILNNTYGGIAHNLRAIPQWPREFLSVFGYESRTETPYHTLATPEQTHVSGEVTERPLAHLHRRGRRSRRHISNDAEPFLTHSYEVSAATHPSLSSAGGARTPAGSLRSYNKGGSQNTIMFGGHRRSGSSEASGAFWRRAWSRLPTSSARKEITNESKRY